MSAPDWEAARSALRWYERMRDTSLRPPIRVLAAFTEWALQHGPALEAAEPVWWCKTHNAHGVPLPWEWESDECWRCVYEGSDGLCRMVKRPLLPENGEPE